MGRDPRYILPNSLQHVVDVVHQNRYLLSPSEELNERFLGVLGRAQQVYRMTICAAVVMSSHFHLLLRPQDGAHLAAFMCFLKTNLSKEVGGRLRGWGAPFFARRYQTSMVSDEEVAQALVLRYVLSHGVKENLVDSVRAWPGVHSASSLIDGSPMRGVWFDRSSSWKRHAADYDGEAMEEGDGSGGGVVEEVELAPLPCWEHLPESQWRLAVREMVDDIDHQAAIERRVSGKGSLGVEAVLSQDPFFAPDDVERSPPSRFFAVGREARAALMEAWGQMLAAYVVASRALRSGDRSAVFPEGTFPPGLPFVPFTCSPVTVLRARGQPA